MELKEESTSLGLHTTTIGEASFSQRDCFIMDQT
jgi:hypothetical protein